MRADRGRPGFVPPTLAAQTAATFQRQSGGRLLLNDVTDELEIYPNLWPGIGPVRGGAGTVLVGSHGEVAERIAEYHRLGIDEFVLFGHPHLEEAYWFGEGVLPRLEEQALWTHPFRSATASLAEAQIPFADR